MYMQTHCENGTTTKCVKITEDYGPDYMDRIGEEGRGYERLIPIQLQKDKRHY